MDASIAVSAKRYRYTGKERDEETGLDSMGVRYYAPWLGRWTSADPIGLGDGVNRYAYVSGNPVGMRDPSGTEARPSVLEVEFLRAKVAATKSRSIAKATGEVRAAEKAFSAARSELIDAAAAAAGGSRATADRLEGANRALDARQAELAGTRDRLSIAKSIGVLPENQKGLVDLGKLVRAEKSIVEANARAEAAGTFDEAGFAAGLRSDLARDLARGAVNELTPLGGFNAANEELAAGNYAAAAIIAGVELLPAPDAVESGLQKGVRELIGDSGQAVQRKTGYSPSDPPVRIDGDWSENDLKQALLGHPPRGLGKPDLHHADQMPGSGVHEVVPGEHRNSPDLHPNKYNQGVTQEMRDQDRKLHWWYRAREQGADQLLPDWIYDR